MTIVAFARKLVLEKATNEVLQAVVFTDFICRFSIKLAFEQAANFFYSFYQAIATAGILK